MSSYRRYVAQHGAAVHRALKQVRSHALETPPDPVTVAWTRDTFRDFAERLRGQTLTLDLGPIHPLLLGFNPGEVTRDPVIAYRGRASKALRCARCVGPGLMKLSVPLTSEDLPDGGICRVCGVDVLIPVVPGTVHCSVCKHAPHGGEAGCHCGCRGTR